MSQRLHKKHRPGLCLAIHHRLALFRRFDGDIPQFADPNAGAAYRLQNQAEPLIFPALRRTAQAGVLLLGQFLFFRAVDLLLQFQRFDLQIVPAVKSKEAVETGQHGVDAPHGVSLLQMLFIADNRFLRDCGLLCVYRKGADIPDIFFDGCGTPFL